MKVKLIRLSDDGSSTIGAFYVDGRFFGFSLEDEFREKKVSGETRIPSGVYVLGIQELVTPLTQRYRQRYPWFENHIHIKDIPNFQGVYIHIGNFEKDTDGCPLIGDIAYSNAKGAGQGKLGTSTEAFKRFYAEVYTRLKNGEKATIEIVDLDRNV